MNVKENLTRVREFISTRECLCHLLERVGEPPPCHRCEVLVLLPESWSAALGVAARCLPWGANAASSSEDSFPTLRECEIALTAINLDPRERPKNIIGTSDIGDLTQ